ncbi:MAG: hypothetical protein JKY65_09080 [Planctomycetes bacterium]|nr:hypothetical protein [Planctomycetota bacterium]
MRPFFVLAALVAFTTLAGSSLAQADPNFRQAKASDVLAAASQVADPVQREAALTELARRRNRGSVAVIGSALEAPQVGVRRAALRLAGSLGRPASPLGEAMAGLAKDEASVREALAWALPRLRQDQAAWERLLIGFVERDPSLAVRREAARSVGRFETVSKASCQVLLRAIVNQELSVAKGAAHGLRGLGRSARGLEPRIRTLALDPKLALKRRLLILRALGGHGQHGVGTLWLARQQVGLTLVAHAELGRSTLGRTLLDLELISTPRAGSDRIDILAAYEREVLLTILPALADLLRRGRHPVIRSGCATLIATLGKDAGSAALSLGKGLTTPGAERASLKALGNLRIEDLKPALPWIRRALQSGSDSQVLDLLVFLSERPKLGLFVVEMISDSLQWGSEGVRARATIALRALGQRAKPAFPLLVACFRQDKSVRVRVFAVATLAMIGGPKVTALLKEMRALLPRVAGKLLRAALSDAIKRVEADD